MAVDSLATFDFKGYCLTETVETKDLKLAISLVSRALKPSGHTKASDAVLGLRLRTKSRFKNETDLELQYEYFAKDLSEYPADIVFHACKECAGKKPWFPSWHELKTIIDQQMKRRRALLFCLEQALENPQEPQNKPSFIPNATTEEKNRVSELMKQILENNLESLK